VWIANQRQSQEIDRRATAEFGIPSAELMESAGEAIYKVALQYEKFAGRICTVCGRGNNGGDGLVVARLASAQYEVICLVAATESSLNENVTFQLELARTAGVKPIFSDDPQFDEVLAEIKTHHLTVDIIIDAILGTGAQGEISGARAKAIQAINSSGAVIVAVDVPSGIETDTGRSLGTHVDATRTVTFGLPKPCFFQNEGLKSCGKWTIADIGFPPKLLLNPTDAFLYDLVDAATLFPCRTKSSHKGSNGHLVIVAGSNLMPGAAVLATQAALRSGIGLVTIASVDSVCRAVSHHCPEALLMPLPEHEGVIAPLASRVLSDSQSKFSAAVFGPGLTQTDMVQEFLAQLWPEWNSPSVIDADALNIVSRGIPLPNARCVLTPHPGEMARLLGSTTADIQATRFESARIANEKFDQTVLLKGAYTLVASNGEPIIVNPTGNPGMATGGMGDVLSGIIGTLLAQGLKPNDAASLGVYWHGVSGDLCASEIGEIGYTASDVASYLPRARAKIIAS